MNKDLTKFDELGYVVIEDFLSDDDLLYFRKLFDDTAEKSKAAQRDTPFILLNRDPSGTRMPGTVNKITAACFFDEGFLKLVNHPTLISTAKQISSFESLECFISQFHPHLSNSFSHSWKQDLFYINGIETRTDYPEEAIEMDGGIICCNIFLKPMETGKNSFLFKEKSHNPVVIYEHNIITNLPWTSWVDESEHLDKTTIELTNEAECTAVFFKLSMIMNVSDNVSGEDAPYFAFHYKNPLYANPVYPFLRADSVYGGWQDLLTIEENYDSFKNINKINNYSFD